MCSLQFEIIGWLFSINPKNEADVACESTTQKTSSNCKCIFHRLHWWRDIRMKGNGGFLEMPFVRSEWLNESVASCWWQVMAELGRKWFQGEPSCTGFSLQHDAIPLRTTHQRWTLTLLCTLSNETESTIFMSFLSSNKRYTSVSFLIFLTFLDNTFVDSELLIFFSPLEFC